MSEATSSDKKKDAGAIWAKTSKSGVKYWSLQVEIDGVKHDLVGFKNKYKETPNQPDIKLYVSTPTEGGGQQAKPAAAKADTDALDAPVSDDLTDLF